MIDLIESAREAGLVGNDAPNIERFAAIIANECAKICESDPYCDDNWDCAAAIRKAFKVEGSSNG